MGSGVVIVARLIFRPRGAIECPKGPPGVEVSVAPAQWVVEHAAAALGEHWCHHVVDVRVRE